MFGLSANPMSGVDYQNIDYAWSPNRDGNLCVYEKGTQVGCYGTYAVSDVLSIAYAGTAVMYLKNEEVIHTTPTSSARTLYISASFADQGATLLNLRAGKPDFKLTAETSLAARQIKTSKGIQIETDCEWRGKGSQRGGAKGSQSIA